jgi:NADPH:quinone reductase-like Zn-dependent oxidoreductase
VTVGSRDDFLAMVAAMKSQQLRPVIDRIYPFAALPDAMAHLQSGQHVGKVCMAHSTERIASAAP